MAVLSRAEIIAKLQEAGRRMKTVQAAAESKNLIRAGGEEALTPIPDLPGGPAAPLSGQPPRSGTP